MKAYWGIGGIYSSMHSLTSTLDGGEWSASRPGRFTPRERAPGTNWIGGWVSPRAVLDAVKRKIPSLRRESKLRTPIVHPVAQRYTDWVVTALTDVLVGSNNFCCHKRKDFTKFSDALTTHTQLCAFSENTVCYCLIEVQYTPAKGKGKVVPVLN
jgi:hypothetical protein